MKIKYYTSRVVPRVLAMMAGIGLSAATASDQPEYGAFPPPAPGEHPRVLLTPGEIPLLKERLAWPLNAEGLRRSREAAAQMDNAASAPGRCLAALSAGRSFQPGDVQSLAGAIREAAFLAMVDPEDPWAKRLPEVLSAFVAKVRAERGGKNEYDMARTLPPIALAYDWGHGVLDDSTRRAVREWLARGLASQAEFLSGQVYGWKKGAEEQRTFNWVSFVTGGFGYACLAIEGEPGYRKEWFDNAASAMSDFLKHSKSSDGAPIELVNYYAYGLSQGAAFLDAMARRGLPVWDSERLRLVPRFWASDQFPWAKGDFNSLADTRDIVSGPWEIYFRLALQWPKDTTMQWVYAQLVQNPSNQMLTPSFQALWATKPDERITSADLEISPDGFFPGAGLAYMRSDWSAGASYLQFQCDPLQAGPSHAHGDRNAFTFAGMEYLWAIDAGLHFPFSLGHNLVLIDGEGQGRFAQRGHPLAFASEGWVAMAGGDAADAYRLRTDWAPEQEEGPDKSGTGGEIINGLYSFPVRPRMDYARRAAGLVRDPRPVAVIADDIREDDAQRTYTWRMTLPLGISARIGEKAAVLSPTAFGRFLRPEASGRQPLPLSFEIPEAGSYRLWMLCGHHYIDPWQWAYSVRVDDGEPALLRMREGDNARPHWQPLLAEGDKLKPKVFELGRGSHRISLSPYSGEGKVYRIALVPTGADLRDPLLRELPEGSVAVEPPLAGPPAGWTTGEDPGPKPSVHVVVCSPVDAGLMASTLRLVNHAGQDQGTVGELRIEKRTDSGRFRVVLLPVREGEKISYQASETRFECSADGAGLLTIDFPQGAPGTNGPVVHVTARSGGETKGFSYGGE